MIKTITTRTAQELDKQVNEFEKETVYKTGISRVFAIQTHTTALADFQLQYTAVILYREMPE